jgi:signal transduction histidine kinase
MSLTVIDNGKGFNASKMSETEALGLAGMRERAALVNGILKFDSQPRQGTKIHFKVPINGQERRGLD